MDEKYDVVVLGTGLKECILSGLMSVEGRKVLHMDRNKYYGGASTSLSPLSELFDKFKIKTKDIEKYGRGRDWNVDLIPKFLMANGKLVALLVHTGVTRYLEFKSIDGSYVFHKGKIHKVPSNETEAISTSLLSFFEKRRLASMLKWVVNVNESDPSSYNSVYSGSLNIHRDNIQHTFTKFGVGDSTQNFVGHALCLYADDSYKTQVPALEVIKRMQLYDQSVARFGKSPYVYPLYGLGELPQAFARLSAVYGGTYMLDKQVEHIVYENGKVVGVKAEGEIAQCDAVICDPSYAPDRVKKVGQVVRAICILTHPVQNHKDVSSMQIIIPQSEVGRRNDIYVCCVSSTHNVCPKNFYIALVATTVETSMPEQELQPGLRLLDPIEQIFYSVDDLFERVDDGSTSRVFISNSYDASTHFESTCEDVLALYQKITGHPFDFSKVTKRLNEDDDS
ncbi:Rab GDP dissociation inhibitor alpha [Clonorchis sinensis]|uniref:Rab GDP dissociation inhibitor n=2 Tax=Clonorchis sinensis TaxID=79923 RepID=A0A3R7G8T9_CLOSI|nr:Rab GDP dissociation inhibitor alpha [Clonorchis sinensis]